MRVLIAANVPAGDRMQMYYDYIKNPLFIRDPEYISGMFTLENIADSIA